VEEMKKHRCSIQILEKLANALDYKIYKDQRIGGNNYYYYYETLDENNKALKHSRNIKELMDFLLDSDKCKSIIEG
jgi:hypothetical protein